MNANKWVTDRVPTLDEWYVYDHNGGIVPSTSILNGEAWKPIPPCEPYVKPKRYEVRVLPTGYAVYDTSNAQHEAYSIPTREAAERIAAIYEEVAP